MSVYIPSINCFVYIYQPGLVVEVVKQYFVPGNYFFKEYLLNSHVWLSENNYPNNKYLIREERTQNIPASSSFLQTPILKRQFYVSSQVEILHMCQELEKLNIKVALKNTCHNNISFFRQYSNAFLSCHCFKLLDFDPSLKSVAYAEN